MSNNGNIDWTKVKTVAMQEAEAKAQEQEQAKSAGRRGTQTEIPREPRTDRELYRLGVLTSCQSRTLPVWTAGETYPQGRRIQHDGIVYEVVAADGVTAEAHQPPDGEGLLGVYRPLSADPTTGETPAGTQDDPIPYIGGMDVVKDKYYSYNGKLYKANLTMPACVWPPDTPGLWQWTEVTGTE